MDTLQQTSLDQVYQSEVVTGAHEQAQATARSTVAIAAGVVLALLLISAGKAKATLEHLQGSFSRRSDAGGAALTSSKGTGALEGLTPRKQAEKLLELAIGNEAGANEEIARRADHWRSKIGWDSQLLALTTVALNSNDLCVRQSGLEVQLAAYGLARDASTVDVLIQSANSSAQAQKIWALWALGAMANRGIETDRVEQVLVSHLKDSDQDSRRWAVEGLALVGTTATIAPLLQTMHDDPSPAVRERAACSLAESGMLSHEQRLAAVPQLVNYTDDNALDSQTHAWAFQALRDITKERLPNDSAAWRNWFASARGE
ncbi:MAG TPA: HEAT repeat domain-containing protein [Candidatus Sulfotelmatobacter sp.]